MPEGALPGQLEALSPPAGHLAVWALGQAGYLLKGGDTVMVIDPYLSDALAEDDGRTTTTLEKSHESRQSAT